MRISKHISFAEATKSQAATRRGISNDPDELQLAKMEKLAEEVFEPVRQHLGNKPIAISSFFRSAAVNEMIGGSSASQHCKGEAIDIDADVFGGMTNLEIFEHIKNNLDYDQLIWEFDNPDGTPRWVHVSYREGNNRKQVLKAYKDLFKTKYKELA